MTRCQRCGSQLVGQPGELGRAGPRSRMRHVVEQRYAPDRPLQRPTRTVLLFGEQPQLRVGRRHLQPAAELLGDGQGPGVPVRGLIQPPPQISDGTELVIGAGSAGLVAEFLLDGQRLAVPVLGVIQQAPVLRDRPELVVGTGYVGELAGSLRDPAELCSPALADRTAAESLLFDAFIPAAYRDSVGRSMAQAAEKWLVFIARHLERTVGGADFA